MENILSKVSDGIERGTAAIGAAIDDINYGPGQGQITPDRYREGEIFTGKW